MLYDHAEYYEVINIDLLIPFASELFILFIYIHIYCWSTMLAITNKNQRQ